MVKLSNYPIVQWKKIFFRIFLVFLLIPLWVFLRTVYRDRIGAFGCFDDCFNYMGGYFLLAGKRLYADIFFNHQPFPAYISAAIQYLTKPEGIYLLIHQHRMFLIYFSMIADMLLVLRFGLVGFGFALLYETTKGYVFGERFLAEAIIVYPLVYLLGLIGEMWRKKNIFGGEVLLAGMLTWFVVFSREPYVPLALTLFGYLLWKHKGNKEKKVSLSVFLLLSGVTIVIHSFPDYFFNLITVNASRPGTEGNIWLTIFYPLMVFFGGQWNLFRWIEVGLAGIFWLLVASLIPVKKTRVRIIVLLIILTLANIRSVAPGEIYYAAFHHIVWYGLFIMAVIGLIREIWERRGYVVAGVSTIAFLGVTIWAFVSPQSYIHEKVDRHAEFTTNFSQIFTIGGIIKTLSTPADTLFLDGWDDLIYWQAKLPSPYRYVWYTSSMYQFARYQEARGDMFLHNPPTFFYGKCVEDVFNPASLPRANEYARLTTSKAPTCVFVLRSKIPEISDTQWAAAREIFDIQKQD